MSTSSDVLIYAHYLVNTPLTGYPHLSGPYTKAEAEKQYYRVHTNAYSHAQVQRLGLFVYRDKGEIHKFNHFSQEYEYYKDVTDQDLEFINQLETRAQERAKSTRYYTMKNIDFLVEQIECTPDEAKKAMNETKGNIWLAMVTLTNQNI